MSTPTTVGMVLCMPCTYDTRTPCLHGRSTHLIAVLVCLQASYPRHQKVQSNSSFVGSGSATQVEQQAPASQAAVDQLQALLQQQQQRRPQQQQQPSSVAHGHTKLMQLMPQQHDNQKEVVESGAQKQRVRSGRAPLRRAVTINGRTRRDS